MPYVIFIVGIVGLIFTGIVHENSEILSVVNALIPSISAFSAAGDSELISSFLESTWWPLYMTLFFSGMTVLAFTASTAVHFTGFISRVFRGNRQTQ